MELGGCAMPAGSNDAKEAAIQRATPTSMPAPAQADAKYREAMDYLSGLKYDKAEPMFYELSEAYESFGQFDKTAECLFWRAYCQEKLGRADEAALGYEELKRFYPETPAAQQARSRLKAMGR